MALPARSLCERERQAGKRLNLFEYRGSGSLWTREIVPDFACIS